MSLVALFIEEVSFHRYPRWSDMLRGVVAAVLENFGYRQVLALWQVWGAVSAWHGRPAVWETMHRTGFETEEAERTEDTEETKTATVGIHN
ncbi:hypothetical protein [Actinoplanes solisilvae]|uniref:hypothetical protein n=1 Tax=Actinoplanes solisilvae TaxID=2486853 RepID=UPI00196A1F16|nr:hypothetical protein [Actinoplanes solisilvae]